MTFQWTGLGCDVCGFGSVEDVENFKPKKPCPECGEVMVEMNKEFAVHMLNDDGSPQAASRRRTPTPLRALQALGRKRDAIEIGAAAEAPNGIEDVEAISGALVLMPRPVFESLGGFDEGYVLHCEDLDLCRRALASGYRIALANRVEVIHHKGTSSRRRPIWVEWQKHRGMLRYFRKFDAAGSSRWLRLLVPVGVWLRFPLAAVRACWRAWRA